MKTAETHISNYGAFRPAATANANGYIVYHASEKYRKLTDEQLVLLTNDDNTLVANAAGLELADREIENYRNNSI